MNYYTFNLRKRFLLTALLGVFTCLQAQAQISVYIQMDKKSYLLGEPVTARLKITNNSGRQLTLSGDRIASWLNFQMSMSGRSVPPARRINYKPAVIPTGQTISRSVNISMNYALGRMGNYTCSASIKTPGSASRSFTSNRVHFTVTSGRKLQMLRAGLPEAPDQVREYQLITFAGNKGLNFYVQLSSQNTGRRIATIPLGRILTFRKPTATLDRANNIHTLYQINPELFNHACISPHGKLLSSTYHKRAASGTPRLITFGNGDVRVAGSVPHNPKAEASKKRKIRRISERPAFLY